MKIAVWHNLPSGGGKRALYSHIKGLVKRGHFVEAWCPETADKEYLPLTEFIAEHRIPTEFNNVSLFERFSKGLNPKGLQKINDFDRHCRVCAEQINKGEFDVLFANSSSFLAVSPIARYVDCPKIIYLQEPYRSNYEFFLTPSNDHSKSQGVIQIFKDAGRRNILVGKERENARRFDKILVNSFYSRESVLRAYGLESTVCYLGTDGELFKPTGELKEDFIIGVGRIGHHKGIDRIIMALGKVDQSTRLPLIWVGDAAQADYMNKMKLLAEKCHVQIQFKVCISDKELISLLSRAKLMVYASRLEPFGFAPLEANACGTPVVAIAEGGVRETIKDGVNGFLVEDADPDIFAKKIKQVLEMPNLDKSNFRARNYVLNDWGWEPAIDRLESSLKSASSKSGVQKP